MKKDELAYSANHTYREGYDHGRADGAAVSEEVRELMCDKYCKMPYRYDVHEWIEVRDKICGACPLNRLEVQHE